MTSPVPAIRPMRSGDAAAVVEMARELAAIVGDPVPELLQSDLVTHGSGPGRWFDCLVAEVGNQLVGYAIVCRAFEAHTAKKRLWVGDLYVRPAARRIGTGRALMTAITRHALELGCGAVYWELWRMNAAGEAFYRELAAEELAELTLMRLDEKGIAALLSADAGFRPKSGAIA
jgi:GNAT superfamily N-acetyltransferase